MIGWLMASLVAVGLFLLVLGAVVDEGPFLVSGGVLIGWALGFTQARLAMWSALADLGDEIARLRAER